MTAALRTCPDDGKLALANVVRVRIVLAGRHPLFRTNLVVDDHRSRNLEIDARRLRFVSPLEICAVAAWAARTLEAGREARFLLPEDPDVASYLLRMDLARVLGDAVVGDDTMISKNRRSGLLPPNDPEWIS